MQVEKGTGPEGMRKLLGVLSNPKVEVRLSAAIPRLRGDVVLYVYDDRRVKSLSGL
jgi:hypothetical protein